jgi:hypothetical protein
MPPVPPSDHRIRTAAIAALGVRCLTLPQLADELRAAGIDLGSGGADRLRDVFSLSTEFAEASAGWFGVAAALDGTRWITSVDANSAQDGLLATHPHLLPFAWWGLDAALTLADTGEPVDVDDDLEADFLTGPAGWLRPYADGYVELHVVGTQLHLSPATVPEIAPPAMVDAVRDAFERHAIVEELRDHGDGAPVDLTQLGVEDLLWESLAASRDAFRSQPIPPIDILLAAAGLARDHFTVVRAGTDGDALHGWQRRNRLAETYGLEAEQVDRAELALGMSLMAMSGEPDPLGPPKKLIGAALVLAFALDDVAVCNAVLGHHLEAGTPPLELAGFARLVVPHLADGEGAGPRWLEGRALDLGGDSDGARAAFEAAVATGEEHPLALIALAGFRADAGDATEAVALLRRAGIEGRAEDADPGDREAFDLLSEVAAYAANRPRPQAGRNDPCPCGSGRKYKACHLGRERHDLVERGPWLYDKVHRYVRDHDRSLVAMVAGEMCSASGEEEFLLELLDSRLVADIALHECGLDEAFVAERNTVLPDDEALLAARWQLVDRSLFEVEEVRKTALHMRDLRSGERITVSNTSPESNTRRGDLMLGRPLPIGDTWRAYSGFVKVVALRDEALAVLDRHDPVAIARLVGRCIAPPTIQNTDGHAMEFHELTWRLPNAEATREILDASDAVMASGDSYHVVRDTAGQPATVVVTFTIAGDELHADVNSGPRADEVIALVADMLPDAALVDHDVRGVREVARSHAATGAEPPHNRLDDPDMAGVREDLALDLEARWVDEHVPALGGLTPREAAVDPIARHDLERLLDSFDGRAGVMNIPRIRKALEL